MGMVYIQGSVYRAFFSVRCLKADLLNEVFTFCVDVLILEGFGNRLLAVCLLHWRKLLRYSRKNVGSTSKLDHLSCGSWRPSLECVDSCFSPSSNISAKLVKKRHPRIVVHAVFGGAFYKYGSSELFINNLLNSAHTFHNVKYKMKNECVSAVLAKSRSGSSSSCVSVCVCVCVLWL